MKRILFYTIIVLLSPIAVQAQVNNWEWAVSGANSASSQGVDIVSDNAGNTYVTGAFEGTLTLGAFSVTSAGNADLYVAKFDPGGQPLWLIREGGLGEDRGYGIAVDASDNVYVCGDFSATINIGNNTYIEAGQRDILLAKYDNNGSIIWSRAWGAAQMDVAWSISISPNRKVYVTGVFSQSVDFDVSTLTSAGGGDIFLLKLDTAGTVLWANKAGGSFTDMGFHVGAEKDGFIYVTGNAGSPNSHFGNGVWLAGMGMFVTLFDTSGSALWTRGATGSNGYGVYANSAKTDNLGNIYLTGYSDLNQNINFGSVTLTNPHAFVAKYNATGVLQWAKHLSTANTDDGAWDLALDAGKNIYIAGFFDFWGVFGTDTIYTNGSWDATISKLDSNGNHIWSAVGGGGTFDEALSLTLDNNGSIVTTGYIASSSANFGPYTVNGVGGQDMFVAKLSQTTGLPVTAGKDKQLYIYPNPANDMLYIKGLKETTGYKIVSITGATLQEGVITKNRNAIDIRGLSPGIYLLYAAGEVHKIVKE